MVQNVHTLELILLQQSHWPSEWPPRNEPKCGYRGDFPVCRTTGMGLHETYNLQSITQNLPQGINERILIIDRNVSEIYIFQSDKSEIINISKACESVELNMNDNVPK